MIKEISKTFNHLDIDQIKQHCRIDINDDNNYLLSAYKAAVLQIEKYLNKKVEETDLQLTKYCFSGKYIKVDESNFISLSSVTYTTNNNSYSIAVSACTVREFYNYFTIELPNSISTDELKITFKAGYQSNKMPQAILQAILITTNDIYDNRNSYSMNNYKELPNIIYLLSGYKKYF